MIKRKNKCKKDQKERKSNKENHVWKIMPNPEFPNLKIKIYFQFTGNLTQLITIFLTLKCKPKSEIPSKFFICMYNSETRNVLIY